MSQLTVVSVNALETSINASTKSRARGAMHHKRHRRNTDVLPTRY